ncbi:MAG: cupin domain-containing protein [Reyranellaceae bacterium]
MQTVNLAEKFARFSDHWSPKLVGQVNGCAIKLVKLSGEFVWHRHDTEDEMFFVIKGRLRMKFRDGEQIVNPGEFIIVPHGVEHLPVAEGETEIMLVEPDTTLNTGNVVNERTVADLQYL